MRIYMSVRKMTVAVYVRGRWLVWGWAKTQAEAIEKRDWAVLFARPLSAWWKMWVISTVAAVRLWIEGNINARVEQCRDHWLWTSRPLIVVYHWLSNWEQDMIGPDHDSEYRRPDGYAPSEWW